MTGIKICGIRREKDIEYVNQYLPQYAGFVFAESRRCVSPEEAGKLIARLDRKVKAVGVFVNESVENVVETALIAGLDILQLHGDESQDYIRALKEEYACRMERNNSSTSGRGSSKEVRIWKTLRISNAESIGLLGNYSVDAYVLDTYSPGSYGGTGKTFDWTLVVEAKRYGKIILAGGLDPENAGRAIQAVNPFAVDVSSGVETDGFKDYRKISAFVDAVKLCNNNR